MNSFDQQDLQRMFPRVSRVVEFRGANTPTEVNERIQTKIDEFPPKLSPGWSAFLRKVIPWFGFATIDEAIANPRGEVALTLKYGRETAKQVVEAQARQYLAYLEKKAKQNKSRRKRLWSG